MQKNRNKLLWLLLIFSLSFIQNASYGQVSKKTITGTVVDSSGTILIGVAIVANGSCTFDPIAKSFTINFTYTNTSNLFRRASIVYVRN